jgi:mono/diheme cytochrome c family protein
MPIFRASVARLIALSCVVGLTLRLSVAEATENASPTVDFVRQVQPLLNAHCARCHGREKQEAGLRLDNGANALAGGDSGPAFVAGRSAESELLARIRSDDEDQRMPPPKAGRQLLPAEISLLKQWIDQGAQWTAEADEAAVVSKHWAYQPIARREPPRVAHAAWVHSPIDAFVLSRLEQEMLTPSAEASRETLLRRLYLDLLGLLPTPEERKAYLADRRPDAYARLVDQLLSSPHFGERWGRHWLDLARYGDSNGYELDIVRPNAWRYRDWVIKAINDDLPYDRFIVEQLAGDLLPKPSLDAQLATGLHRMTIKNTESGVNREDYRNREMVDRVNTTAAAVLGITLGCAQCHSHKYDPISQQEYYRFYAFFNNIEEVEIDLPATPAEKIAYAEALSAYLDKWLALQARQRITDGLAKQGPAKSAAVLDAALQAARKQLTAQKSLESLGLEKWVEATPAAMQKELAAPDPIPGLLKRTNKGYDFQQKSFRRYMAALGVLSAKLEQKVTSAETYAAELDEPAEVCQALCLPSEGRTAEQNRLVEEYCQLLPAKRDEVHEALRLLVNEERYLPEPQILALKENTSKPRPTHVLMRGDFKQPGPEVVPGTPAVLPPLKCRDSRPDRLDLATWLVDPANPLTARVAVNHVWAHLFGRGLVSTVDDFGVQGDRPSHPQLLDWLASEFVRAGWSRKQLVRTIVLSSTYRQSSALRSELEERDPLNTLLARQARFRVEAETVRDLFLSASGLLNPSLGGPTIFPAIPDSVRDIAYKYKIVWPTSSGPERYRRGLYIHFRRSNPYPSLLVFDAPEGTACAAQRNRSNTPLQALTTLNDPVFLENAQALGRRVLSECPSGGTDVGDTAERIRWLFTTCLVRQPSAAEAAVLKELFQAEQRAYQADTRQAAELVGTPSTKEPEADAAAWTATARAIVNLDEFLTRE